MTKPIILLKDRRPDSAFIDQIYDPDNDGEWTEDSPKVVPNEGATVTDRNTGGLYYVVRVDQDTLKSTLAPSRIVVTSENQEVVKILSYGNDKFMLFYDDRVKPTKLNIDGKLIVFGSSLAEYQLVRTTSDGKREIISLYLENNESYRGERIPLANIGSATGAKQCTNCHTLFPMKDGDTIEVEIYDNLGILSIIVELYTKRATILNDLASTNEIVVGFDATSNQMLGSDFYVHQRQDPAHLAITPRLEYSDGTTEDLTINSVDCFLYGLEDFVPAFPGQKHKIMIKKFLSNKQISPIAVQTEKERYVSCEKLITVIANKSLDGIKVSLMPIWDLATSSYILKYVAYSDRRDKIYDVTNNVTEISKFHGNKFNQLQTHMFDVNLSEVFGASVTVPYRQLNVLQLKPNSEFQKYTISDNTDLNPIYGVESSIVRRPVIMYDSTIEQYFIPTSRFTNKEAFLEAFYYNAAPPFDPNESLDPPVPTHFTIRALDDLSTLITTPIEIDQYQQAWNINRPGNQSILTGYNVIVEFLQLTTNGTYLILYGVPVDVYVSNSKYTNYNTETNNLP